MMLTESPGNFEDEDAVITRIAGQNAGGTPWLAMRKAALGKDIFVANDAAEQTIEKPTSV